MSNKIKAFFTNKQGRVVIVQVPNLPLIAWLVFMILAMIFKKGEPHIWLSALSDISLGIWAVLEIGWGASYFRRLLGVVVLVALVLSRL